MQHTPVIRPLEASEWTVYRDARLRSLADSPDAFGSTLAAEQERSDDAWAARLAAATASGKDRALIAVVNGQAAGLVWGKVDSADASVVNVFQMWVAPEARGQSIGRLLLQEVVQWARQVQARSVRLGVVQGDTPAVRLYTRLGFMPLGLTEPLRDGSALMSQTMELTLS